MIFYIVTHSNINEWNHVLQFFYGKLKLTYTNKEILLL